METRYRIIEGIGTAYVESSHKWLWFTRWRRHEGNYGTAARAEAYIIESAGYDSRYVWPYRIVEYTGKPFNPGSPPIRLYS